MFAVPAVDVLSLSSMERGDDDGPPLLRCVGRIDADGALCSTPPEDTLRKQVARTEIHGLLLSTAQALVHGTTYRLGPRIHRAGVCTLTS